MINIGEFETLLSLEIKTNFNFKGMVYERLQKQAAQPDIKFIEIPPPVINTTGIPEKNNTCRIETRGSINTKVNIFTNGLLN